MHSNSVAIDRMVLEFEFGNLLFGQLFTDRPTDS